jgi:hypothetical protein
MALDAVSAAALLLDRVHHDADADDQEQQLHELGHGQDRSSVPLTCGPEVSGHLVGSTAFKAVGTGDPRPAGSIPVHLRGSGPWVAQPVEQGVAPREHVTHERLTIARAAVS